MQLYSFQRKLENSLNGLLDEGKFDFYNVVDSVLKLHQEIMIDHVPIKNPIINKFEGAQYFILRVKFAENIPTHKIKMIKFVRDFMDKGLREAKEYVEQNEYHEFFGKRDEINKIAAIAQQFNIQECLEVKCLKVVESDY